MGLRAGRGKHIQGHEPVDGLPQGAIDVGEVGGLQRQHSQDHGLLPRDLSNALPVSWFARLNQTPRCSSFP